MKTEIIEIKKIKKFKPFKMVFTIETEEEAEEILEQLGETKVRYLFQPYAALKNHLKLMNAS